MSWISIAAIYVIVWWMVLFMVLPFGVRKVDNPEAGHEHGAPARPRMILKALITSLIAAAVTVVVWAVIAYGWIDFRGPMV